jgi:hypothetical protein
VFNRLVGHTGFDATGTYRLFTLEDHSGHGKMDVILLTTTSASCEKIYGKCLHVVTDANSNAPNLPENSRGLDKAVPTDSICAANLFRSRCRTTTTGSASELPVKAK